MATARKPVPAGGQPTPAVIASADSTPPAGDTDQTNGATDSTPPVDKPADADQGVADTDIVDARVLVAFDDHQPDDIVSAPAGAIEQLKLAGRADPHPDAVAYARSLRA